MIELTIDGAVARLTLDRPEARNAIDARWIGELDAAVADLAGRNGIRALLIEATGVTFTVGGDIDHFHRELDRLADELDSMVTGFHRALQAIAELPYPVVCAVQGAVAGGGLGLLWASDVVLLAEGAKLATAFAAIGLSGDGGSSWYLPRLVGLRRASQLLLLDRRLSAVEALDWGLADAVVPAEQLATEAAARAAQLAAGPTLAYAAMRRNLRAALERPLPAGLHAELAAMRETGASADGREGIDAFAGRRSPTFDGS